MRWLPLRPARSWGPPPWLWLTLALFLAQLPALIGHTLDVSTGLGRVGGAELGRFVTALLSLVQLLPQFFLLVAVLALLAPRARRRLVERRHGLLAPDDPLMAPPAPAPGSPDGDVRPHFAAAMAAFVHTHAPGTRLRLSTQDGISARVYPGSWRTAHVGVFAPLVHLWHTDTDAARAVLLHELGHLRKGEQHATGLGSPLTALPGTAARPRKSGRKSANPLCGTVLRVPVVQHLAVCIDFQHIVIDRDDLLQRRTELKESRSVA
ncbi:hypothetical protein ACFXAW_30440 [Streptomyces sp. NPDC059445]|uniref:hypothetical protein n=1 Tax=Streptomyces sp. NPDC059445 TaxID=3346832 RepID=UPI003681A87F